MTMSDFNSDPNRPSPLSNENPFAEVETAQHSLQTLPLERYNQHCDDETGVEKIELYSGGSSSDEYVLPNVGHLTYFSLVSVGAEQSPGTFDDPLDQLSEAPVKSEEECKSSVEVLASNSEHFELKSEIVDDNDKAVANDMPQLVSRRGNLSKVSCSKTKKLKTKARSQSKSCKLCDASFSTLPQLKAHQTKVHIRRPSVPIIDSATLQNILDGNKLRLVRIDFGNYSLNRYQCCTCQWSIAALRLAVDHQNIHRNERPYSCKICNSHYHTVQHLSIHLQRKHKQRMPITCSYCSKQCNMNSIGTHENKHIKLSHYQCNLCDVSVRWVALMTSHLKNVHSVGITSQARGASRHISNKRASRARLRKGEISVSKRSRNSLNYTHLDNEERFNSDKKAPQIRRNRPKRVSDCKTTIKQENGTSRLKLGKQTFHTCRTCSQQFSTQRELINHRYVHQKAKRFSGEFTLAVTFEPNSSQLKVVEKDYGSYIRKLYQCQTCEQCFLTLWNLKDHENVHRGGKELSCNQCELKFQTVLQLSQHNRKSHNMLCLWKCGHCGVVFSSGLKYRKHEYQFTGFKSFKCKFCDASFKYRQNIVQHCKVRHGLRNCISAENKRQFDCETCNRTFTRRTALLLHKSIHTGEKSHVCETCGNCYRIKELLKRHREREHSAVVSPCATCGKTFETKFAMNRHAKRHTWGTFHCNVCNKEFAQRTSLKGHMTIHSGEKPFVCPVCNRCFREVCVLRAHLRAHTGDHPFGCPFCAKSFESNRDLRKHADSRHPGQDIGNVSKSKQLQSSQIVRTIVSSSPSTRESLIECRDNINVLQPITRTHAGEISCISPTSFISSVNNELPEKWKLQLQLTGAKSADSTPVMSHLNDDSVKTASQILVSQSHFTQECVPSNQVQVRSNEQGNAAQQSKPKASKIKNKRVNNVLRNQVTHHSLRQKNLDINTLINETAKDIPKSSAVHDRCTIRKQQTHLSDESPENDSSFDHCSENKVTKDDIDGGEHDPDPYEKHYYVNRPFKCSKCDYSSTSDLIIADHENIHNGERPYACKNCTKRFSTFSSLWTHAYEVHKMKEVAKCDVCSKEMQYFNTFKIHRNRHTGLRPYVCRKCGKACITQGGIWNHVQTCFALTKAPKFTCETCGVSCRSLQLLKDHINTHRGEKPYACVDCGQHFSKSGSLYAHIINQHPKGESKQRSFLCKICGKMFNNASSLWYHTNNRHNGVFYNCAQCEKSFTNNASLKRHMSTHTDEKPFVCDVCSRTFRRSDGLKEHINTHTGEHRFRCDHCQRKFASTRDLKKHLDSKHHMVNT